MARAIKKVSIAEQVAAELRREILSGELPAGSRLPPERDLAPELGTNRNTLREAVRLLESWKLVRVRQGDGVTVQDYRRTGEINLLPFFLLEGGDVRERARVFGEVLSLRRMVLADAAAQAATHATEDEIGDLRELVRCIRASLGGEEVLQLDLEFFGKLIEATGSLTKRWVFNTFSAVYNELILVMPSIWLQVEGYPDQLERLVNVMAEGESTEARRLIETYLGQVDQLLAGRGLIPGKADS